MSTRCISSTVEGNTFNVCVYMMVRWWYTGGLVKIGSPPPPPTHTHTHTQPHFPTPLKLSMGMCHQNIINLVENLSQNACPQTSLHGSTITTLL